MKFGLLHLGLVPLLTSCSEAALSKALSSEDAEMADAGSAAENYDDGDYGAEDGFEPEEEEELLALLPATTPEFVFVANPDRNTVTRISVPDLSVITTEVPSLV